MKKVGLLGIVLLLVSVAVAQEMMFYVNGQKVSPEVAKSIAVDRIESMNKSVEEGVPVVRITLKGDQSPDVSLDAEPNPSSDADTARSNRLKIGIAQALNDVYEKTTLLKEGAEAADFTAPRFEGDSVRLSSLRGKVVLLNFWATWCAPCLAELAPDRLPAIVLARFADNPDFVFLPVAYTDSPQTLSRFFATENGKSIYAYLRTCTAMDADKSVFQRYAEKSVPRSFVIDRHGRIVHGSVGNSEEGLQKIAEAVAGALGE